MTSTFDRRLEEIASSFTDPGSRQLVAADLLEIRRLGGSSLARIRALAKDDGRVAEERAVALWWLGQLRDVASQPLLLGIVSAANETSVMWEAAKALVLVTDSDWRAETERKLLRLLDNMDQPARLEPAIFALGMLGGPTAQTRLTEIAADESAAPALREAARNALGG